MYGKIHYGKGISTENLIIYELHTGTFSDAGTFDGIAGKLKYLKELGITAIELMPVAQFPGTRNWGYDGVFPFAVQNSYGGAERLQKLVDSCHQENIAVILDVVYNHLGPREITLQPLDLILPINIKHPGDQLLTLMMNGPMRYEGISLKTQ